MAAKPPSAYNFPCIFMAFSVLAALPSRKSNWVNHFHQAIPISRDRNTGCLRHRVVHLMSIKVSDSLQPHWLQPTRLLCPWDSPDKNPGVGCHARLQGIFPALEASNLHILHLLQWQADSLPLSHVRVHVLYAVSSWWFYFTSSSLHLLTFSPCIARPPTTGNKSSVLCISGLASSLLYSLRVLWFFF